MSSITAGSHAHDDAQSQDASVGSFLSTYVFSLDHKVIGLQFLFSTLLWFLVGGLLALGIRWQLAYPWSNMPVLGDMLYPTEGGQIAPEFYTVLFTMHATVMIFFVIIPILAGAFGNYLIPLMIGADDMAFPTLNMLSYWFMWPAFILYWGQFFHCRSWSGGGMDVVSTPLRRDGIGAGQRYAADAVAARSDLCWGLVDDGLGQLHDHHHSDASPWNDDVPAATDDLEHVHHRRTPRHSLCLS